MLSVEKKAALLGMPQLREQPCFGKAPAPLDSPFGDTHQVGNLPILQSGKKPQLHDFCLGIVKLGEAIQRLVNLQEALVVKLSGQLKAFELNSLLAAAVADLLFAAGIVNQDPPHALGCGGKEVRAILPGLVGGAGQANPSLVDQGGGLKGLACSLVGQACVRPASAVPRKPIEAIPKRRDAVRPLQQ